ncbi:MAG: RNA methyltransferase [Hyphomicrobiales bacterium]|nr:RNA methyltransferase [Hyphomicrobiales bacterium]
MPPKNRPRPPSRRAAPRRRRDAGKSTTDRYFIYGLHPALMALANPDRRIDRVVATPNGLARLRDAGAQIPASVEQVQPGALDRLLGGDAVHQGVALEVAPLEFGDIETLADSRLLVCLDQISDPHNVGAILRSAAALGADGVVSTTRHAAPESGVLAKSASGALDVIPPVVVPNLARALTDLGNAGFVRIGLDEAADATIDDAMVGERIVLVLGAEGKGLRRLTRDTCDRLARLPTRAPIASLNVSNAAALALYVARRHLDREIGRS